MKRCWDQNRPTFDEVGQLLETFKQEELPKIPKELIKQYDSKAKSQLTPDKPSMLDNDVESEEEDDDLTGHHHAVPQAATSRYQVC